MTESMIYAGLDTDGIAKLFFMKDGEPVPIGNTDWVRILDLHRANMGEMLLVHLMREPDDNYTLTGPIPT